MVQFSVDGGISWNTLYSLPYKQYQQPSDVYVQLPPAAQTPSTMIRWVQPWVHYINKTTGKLEGKLEITKILEMLKGFFKFTIGLYY